MRFACALIGLLCFSLNVSAQIIVSDDFESYMTPQGAPDDTAFQLQWAPDQGDGQTPIAGPIGLLAPNDFDPAPWDGSGDPTVTPPLEPLQGQAVTFADAGGINESVAEFSLTPTDTTSIRFSGDLLDFLNGNRRFSIGLRNDTVDRDPSPGTVWGLNFVELGFWNSDQPDPTDPETMIPSTGYFYRNVLFGGFGGDLVQEPNRGYFPIPIEYDGCDITDIDCDPQFAGPDHNNDGRFGDGDGIPTQSDVGPGWHSYYATIALDTVTMELDLHRDGIIDSKVQWQLTLANDPDTGEIAPFTSFRMGGVSGVGTNEYTMVDNVALQIMLNGDYNNDGVVGAGI